MAVRYSDGVVFGNAITSDTVHVQLRSDSSPDEAGCRFTVPVTMTVMGIRVGLHTSWGASATATIKLYNDSDTILASISVADKDFVDDSGTVDVFFDSVNLIAGITYRAAVEATAAGSGGNTFLQRYQFDSTDAKAAWPCGADWQFTERTDAGAWMDTITDLSYIGLWVSAIEFTSQYANAG